MIENELFFQQLVVECRDIVTESSFASRWSLVEGYHLLGSRILQDEVKLTQGGTNLRNTLQGIAKLVGKRERSLYYAVEFVRKFPDLNTLPEGKDTNWFRIVHKYLTTESDRPKQLAKQDLISIIFKIKELLKVEYQKAKQNELNNTLPEYSKLSEFVFYLQDSIQDSIEKMEVNSE